MVETTRPKVILVVDDDQDMRELVGAMLENEGHTVRLADGGEAALGEVATEVA